MVRAGFRLDELRHMPMADFIAYADCLAEVAPDTDGARPATQEDIDAFFR